MRFKATSHSGKAFTLIELLVVVSIISLMSSIVLATLNTVREKGRIGGGRSFEAQAYHLAGDSAVGLWNFDECSGSTAKDGSGFNNTATLIGSPVWSSDTPSGKGCSLIFSGTNYVTVPDSQSLEASASVTVSLWVKLTTLNSYQTLVSKGSCNAGFYNDSYVLCVAGSGSSLLYYGTVDGSTFINTNAGITASELGRWMHIIAVIDSTTSKISIYKDGKLASAAAYTGGIRIGSETLFIGGDGAFNLTGSIDEVRIYAKGLTAMEAGKLYASENRRFADQMAIN